MKLTWGSLDLTATPYLVEFGFEPGAPANETVALPFLLQDGEIELSSRAGNRTLQFNVLIEGASLTVLATGEAALLAESERLLNTITVDPEDGAPVAVYEVFRGQVTLTRDDAWEMDRKRRYAVTVRAYPFVRSATETVTAALAASGTTTTLVNDGSATTNWTGAVSAGTLTGPTVVSGAVKVGTTAAITGACTVTSTYTASITTSSTKYLPVDWKPESSVGSPDLRAFGDGTELTRAASIGLPSGLTRTWFGPVVASSIAVLRLESLSVTVPNILGYDPPAIRSLYVDNINRTDVKPAIGTNRQLQRRIAVGGSARSRGSLAVEHASSALGDAIVYVWPSGDPVMDAMSPPCRQFRTAGPSVTADSAMISGSRETLAVATPTVFTIPNNALPPGLYTAVARLRYTLVIGGVTVTASAGAKIGGSAVGPTQTLATRTYSSPSTGWVNTTLGRFNLPTLDVQAASAATTTVTLTTTIVSNSTLELDELWLFHQSGALVMVACGTAAPSASGSSNRMFVDQPTVDRPRPVVLIGNAADGSDAHYPTGEFTAWQLPEFSPPGANILTVTSNALDAAASFRAFDRWHTNPAS